MTLRPASACWFELLTSREELGATLDCLAGTGTVQLEAYSRSEQRLALPDLRATLAEYETLARRTQSTCATQPSTTCSRRRAMRSNACAAGPRRPTR